MDESDRRDNRHGFVRELAEQGNEAADANLAKDLAERMIEEFKKRGCRAEVVLHPTLPVSVLIEAMTFFRGEYPGMYPVLKEHYIGLLRMGRFTFVRKDQL